MKKKNFIGESFAALRRASGMKAEELGSLMAQRGYNWSPVTVSRIENGNRELKFMEAVEALSIMGYESEDLCKLAQGSQEMEIYLTLQKLYTAEDALFGAANKMDKAYKELARLCNEGARGTEAEEAEYLLKRRSLTYAELATLFMADVGVKPYFAPEEVGDNIQEKSWEEMWLDTVGSRKSPSHGEETTELPARKTSVSTSAQESAASASRTDEQES